MNRQKKTIYLGVLGLGLLGLIADRVLRSDSGPATASAGLPGAAVEEPFEQAEEDDRVAILPATFPEAPAATSIADLRDPFSVTKTVLDILRPSTGTGSTVNRSDPSRSARQQFVTDHVLEAVITTGAHAAAVIDGVLITRGQRFGGCTISDIEPRSVQFTCADGDGELRLATLMGPDLTEESPEETPAGTDVDNVVD